MSSFTHKPNIVDFISDSASEELHLTLQGHLHIEALMNELLYRSFSEPDVMNDLRQTFYNKVKLLRALGRIDLKLESVLLNINALRNKVAHRLHFQVTFDDAFELVEVAAAAGIDFSDETIFRDKKASESHYGTIGILTEVIANTFAELIWRNEPMFTQEEISNFLG